MNISVFIRLCVMMFLQFFIWGAWYVTAPRYLGQIGFDGPDIGWTYSVGPIAGMLSPFLVGMIADRFFSTERVLAAMHLVGGVLMFVATMLMTSTAPVPAAINGVFFGYMLCYFPTLALTNSLAMQNMANSEKEFPFIRVFGTIGWIVAGVVIGFAGWGDSIEMFYVAAIASIALGVFSIILPHTPPPSAGKDVSLAEVMGLNAIGMLARPSYLVFMISSFLICIPLAFYYQLAERTVAQTGVANPPFVMTFGQMSEIFFMVLMPLFFVRLGVKWMLAVGMLAWVVRYALFAIGAPNDIIWMVIIGVLLHGICYDFFFVTGQIYTDKAAPPGIRSQAQGMLVLFTLGLGMFIGAQCAGWIEKLYTPPESVALSDRVKEINIQLTKLNERKESPGADKAAIDREIKDLTATKNELALASLKEMEWRKIWTIPCIGAGVILLLFVLVFRDDTKRDEDVTAAKTIAADVTEAK